MGKISHDRHIHFPYFPEFIEHWKIQPPELKAKCREIGQPYGYSGMNVFFIWFLLYFSHNTAGITFKEFKHQL